MDFLKHLTIGARKGRIQTLPELSNAICEGAAFLAQGSIYSYMRARTGTMGPRLMQDAGFGVGMERCKWEGFAAAAGDLVLIIETELRPRQTAPARVWRRLFREALASQDLPEHRAATGWDDQLAEFHLRLDAHLGQPKRGIEELCEHTAAVLLANAPITETIRELDREMVTNNVKFRFIEHVDALRRRVDWTALADGISLAAQEAAGESDAEPRGEPG